MEHLTAFRVQYSRYLNRKYQKGNFSSIDYVVDLYSINTVKSNTVIQTLTLKHGSHGNILTTCVSCVKRRLKLCHTS